MIEFGAKPFSNAAAYTIGLKAEPGCLLACVTLLNSLFLKLNPPTKAYTSPVNGSSITIPPLTFGYCFKTQEFFSFLTKTISPILCMSFGDFFFGIDHLKFLKNIIPSKFFFPFIVLKPISLLVTEKISAKCQFKVGSSLYCSILFSQFFFLILLVIGPLQPCLLS